MRVSEFTVLGEFDPEFNLILQDLSLCTDLSTATLRIKVSKTDPFRKGCTVTLGATPDLLLCPVKALLSYLLRRSATNGPLFKLSNGRPASRNWCCRRLKEVTGSTGASGDFTSHSLRIGVASAAAAAGLPEHTIKTLGRWSSDAYKLYLRMSADSKTLRPRL